MSKNVKLQGIPPSAFYSEANKQLGENFVRYCFIKVRLLSSNIDISYYYCCSQKKDAQSLLSYACGDITHKLIQLIVCKC